MMPSHSILMLLSSVLSYQQIESVPTVSKPSLQSVPSRHASLARIFIHDSKTCTMRWSDAFINQENGLEITSPRLVSNIKTQDQSRQRFVQRQEFGGILVAGIRDQMNGELESGHVVIDTGIGKMDHGNHIHWSYLREPDVVASQLGTDQGNPAHVYLYNKQIYVANDRNNGYTRINPARYRNDEGDIIGKDNPSFFEGGGNHITLAVTDDHLGYSTWIDGGGPNKGRVDVTHLSLKSKSKKFQSFHLPYGGIHGATVCQDKVFFATSNGVCWIKCEPMIGTKQSDIKIGHISLGKDGDQPARTGSFTCLDKYVIFVTGKGESSRLVIIDSSKEKPLIIADFNIIIPNGHSLTKPVALKTFDHRSYVFVFSDQSTDRGKHQEMLNIIDLDPNQDGLLNDLKILSKIPVGSSCVQGHTGHHSIAFDSSRSHAFITNPGDGTISVLPIGTMPKSPSISKVFSIGGSPSGIIVTGGNCSE